MTARKQRAESPHSTTGHEPTTMTAVVYSEYGGPEVLRLDEVDLPTPGDDDVLVRVMARSVNAGDWHLLRGTPFLVRLVYGGYRKPKFPILGVDIAGRVEAVGMNVVDFQSGDEVVADLSKNGFGGFAEYVSLPASAVVRKPATVSFEAAAAAPTAGVAALQALRDVGKLQSGETVLVNGASGGVGTFAVQIAKFLGAEVTAVCSTAKMETVRAIGADHVIDYTQEDVTERETEYDLILDAAGTHSMRSYARVLRPTGRYVFVGGPTRRFVTALLAGPMLSMTGGKRFRTFMLNPDRDDLAFVMELLESGDVEPVIDRQYHLGEVPAAIQDLEAGRVTGKLVVV
ncbi:NAD(P)-dependent alcohol dehydrogenase [Haloferax sp. Atlit-12N]|uniref:NAD(P)-dependent alcohol dehydrogenase n=1 Tax=Haloferax sp. Atlit-12N TaxID=2077203 RepID=UPI001F276712|nr:NAD(P)-dependent alcohol dehydrogenase [Haloferax sp. Atlit-12N]